MNLAFFCYASHNTRWPFVTWLMSESGNRGRVHRFYHSSWFRVGSGWTLLIAASLSTFIWARNDVIADRRKQMKIRQKIARQVQEQNEAEIK